MNINPSLRGSFTRSNLIKNNLFTCEIASLMLAMTIIHFFCI
jgi:hypothetical protein